MTAPQQHAQAVLSDEQISNIYTEVMGKSGNAVVAFARAILASQQPAAAPDDAEQWKDGYSQGFEAGKWAAAPAIQQPDAAPSAPKRLTPKEVSEQIARDAIDGAILKGRMDIDPPPTPDHWLNEYWQIGRQLTEYGKTGVDNVNPPDDSAAPAIQQEGAALDERAAFEHHERASDLERNPSGPPDDYANPYVQSSWDGWQARAAFASPAPVQADSERDSDLLAAVGKLIKVKGRFHTERNYAAVVIAYDAAVVAKGGAV